jgi:hypothetical protein
MAQHDAIYSHSNVSTQLSSSSVTFSVHEKLLEYDIVAKVRSNSLSREEVSGLIQESEEESREYDREIGRLQTEIEKLKAEVGRVESTIVALRKEQKKLDTVTNEFRTALCPGPICKLPPEILSEIFKLAFPSTETEERPNKVRTDRSSHIKPLSLARTCVHWRSIAFDTPSLWSGIMITLSDVRDDGHPRMTACERAVAFVLERSKNHPLSLFIDWIDDDPPLPRAMECLIRESCRWDFVELCLPPTSSAFNFWGLTLDLPNLCSFGLTIWEGKESSVEPLCLAAFQNAPMLRNLDGIKLNERIQVLLPWHQLETVICSCSEDYCPARLISSCTNLKSAHILYERDWMLRWSSIPVPTSISTLILEGPVSYYSLGSMIQCLEQLQLNSPRSLIINFDFSVQSPQYFETLIELVGEYKSLTKLRLCHVAIRNKSHMPYDFIAYEGILELLKDLTSLESLEIVEGNSEPVDDGILRDLFVQSLTVSRVENYRQQDTPILPVLQHLIFEAWGEHLKDKSLVDLVCSRWCSLTSDRGVDTPVESSSVTSLSSVRFVLTKRRCDAEVFQPLVDMAAAGLNVTVIDSFGRVI